MRISPVYLALAAGLLAVLFRAWLLMRHPFDGLYGQDAYFYLTATRDLVKAWTDPARLSSWLTTWGTPPTSIWPLGYHIQVMLVALFTGLNASAGQALSLGAGVLTSALCPLISIEAWRQASHETAGAPLPAYVAVGALLSGLIMAASGLAVNSSVVMMADMPSVAWATLGVYLALLYVGRDGNSTRLGILAGLCFGVASVTRYIYPLLLVPVLAYALLAMRVADVRSARSTARSLFPLVAPSIALVSLQLLHNLIHPMASIASPVITNWNPLNLPGTHFTGPDGQLTYTHSMASFFFIRPLVTYDAIGPLLVIFLTIGVIWLAASRAIAVFGLLVGWWLLFAVFYSGSIYQADRFIISYLPALAVLCGLGATTVLWVASSMARVNLAFAAYAGVALVGMVSGAGLLLSAREANAAVRNLAAGKQDYLAASGCVRSLVGQTSRTPVFSFGVTFTLSEYTATNPRELYLETPQSVDAAVKSSEGPVRGYLILPLDRFEAQWGATPMGATYHHLQSAYRLLPLACPGTSLSLFEIR